MLSALTMSCEKAGLNKRNGGTEGNNPCADFFFLRSSVSLVQSYSLILEAVISITGGERSFLMSNENTPRLPFPTKHEPTPQAEHDAKYQVSAYGECQKF
jgi:hypothetical protein